MTRDDAERLTRIHGNTMTYRDKVAVVTFVAAHAGWDAVTDLADMWELDTARQEQIYREVTR